MVPNCAAKAAPVRPQRMMPVMMQAISRTRGHGHEIRRVDGRAELGQLGGADEGEDHSDEEVDQGHDAQRLRPALPG